MDPVDLLILDEMTTPGPLLFSGLDPQRSPSQIGERIGLPESSIRTRMRAWQSSGFVARWNLIPHPGALGLKHMVGYLQAPDSESRARLLEALVSMEGRVSQFENTGRRIGVGTFAADGGRTRAALDDVCQAAGAAILSPLGDVKVQHEIERWPASDIRFVDQLRRSKKMVRGDVAGALAEAGPDAADRLDRLIAGGALYSIPDLDFSCFPNALVRVMYTQDGGDPRGTYDALAGKHDTFFFRDIGTDDTTRGHAMVAMRSMSLLDDLEATLHALPGVTDVTFHVPVRYAVGSPWLDRVLSEGAR